MKIKKIEELQKMNLKKIYELKKEVEKELDELSNNIYDNTYDIEEDEATQELMNDVEALEQQKQDSINYYEDIKQVIREKEEE